ncbi:MAG: hypothetical protein EP330_01860 [Deltaproteobacteria bacterium]|nr:MAG: hypothetical protein EP330_01860 [Deltaproteobacteria bacterium]
MSQRSLPSRLAVFFSAMFPLAVMVPGGAIQYLVLFFGLQVLAGNDTLHTGVAAISGCASAILFALQMRVYDELKDVETDLRLGASGDPRFADRPIVKGDILPSDLVMLRWVVTGLLFATVVPVGTPLVWGTFLLAFFLMWLSFQWFFWPAIKTNIVLAFVTHNPLTFFVELFGAAIAMTVIDDGELLTPANFALMVGLWFPVAAWELSRKVRTEADETDYETYSRRIGWKTASLLPAGFVAVSAASFVYVVLQAGLPVWMAAVIGLAAALPVGACLQFRMNPTTAGSDRLRPLVEGYAAVANLLLVGGFVWSTGVSWP